MVQHRTASRSVQDFAAHLHLKNKGHPFDEQTIGQFWSDRKDFLKDGWRKPFLFKAITEKRGGTFWFKKTGIYNSVQQLNEKKWNK